jgi:TRAP-type C4-dicarboxylate transport system permease small subunit
MKAVVAKLFPTLAGIVLVVPFLVVALMVGHYALAGAGRGANNWLFGALALCGVAYGVVAGRPVGMQLSWPAVARRTRP